jgi:hypothetical protein
MKCLAVAILFASGVGTCAFAQTTTTGPTKPSVSEPITSGQASGRSTVQQEIPKPSPAEQLRCKERAPEQLNEPARSACGELDK